MDRCNNTSVGILVRRDGQLLLIQRRNPPYGWAPPAGHVDKGETYADAAARELREEAGLRAVELRLVLIDTHENRCRRPGGDHHRWRVFDAVRWVGEPVRSEEETCAMRWVTQRDLEELVEITLAHLAVNAGPDQWRDQPGLEPVWMKMLSTITGMRL
jgi:ADP-ribose pyrophosphatase YjhB (NUDIX family)